MEGNTKTIFDFTVKNIDGSEVKLSAYEGKVCLVVNVASKWGLTAVNYAEMEKLHEKYSQKGFIILAFPCNQFANQEPGTSTEIKEFATCRRLTKGPNFELFSKVKVNGKEADPLFQFLASHPNTTGFLVNSIKWNFTKFLCSKAGVPMKRFSPTTKPLQLCDMIEAQLKEPYEMNKEFM